MEYSIYINQIRAVEWGLSMGEATLFGYLINSTGWMKSLSNNPDFKWANNAKLTQELPLVCAHQGSARRHMATLEEKGVIDRQTAGNKSYFRITEKGWSWRTSSAVKVNESVHPEPKGERNGSAKANESVHPRANESVHQSDIPSLSVNQDQVKDLQQASPAGPPPPKKEPKSAAVWTAYAAAYKARYGAEPVRNQTINSQLCKFVDRVGVDDAPDVAAYFLTNNKRWYVEKRHAVGTMLLDAEALHNEWITGTRVTATGAQQLDRKQSNLDTIDAVIAMRKSEGKM